MGHNQIKWTISEEKALRLIHRTMIDLIRSQSKNFISLNELAFLLNNRTRSCHIHPQKKHNRLTKYIAIKYGSLPKFIKAYDIYRYTKINKNDYVYLNDDNNITSDDLIDSCIDRITPNSDWVMIDENNIS